MSMMTHQTHSRAIFLSIDSCGGGYKIQSGEWCYAYIHEPRDWADAESVCRALGGQLAEIFTSEENDAVEKMYGYFNISDTFIFRIFFFSYYLG